MTLLLSLAGALLGALWLGRELARLEFRPWRVLGAVTLLAAAGFACAAALFRWLAA